MNLFNKTSAGTKIKNMFSKISAGEKSAKLLFDQAMRINNIKVDSNEIFNFDKLSELSKKDLPRAVELLSKWYTEGKLSTQVMQKMFTGRHFMEISNALIQINGDIDTFVNGITKGVSYSADFDKNMLNINNQWKQFLNNVNAMGQTMFVGDSITGILIGANSLLKTMNKLNPQFREAIGSLTTLTSTFGLATLAVSSFKVALAPILKTGVITQLANPYVLAIAGVVSALTVIGSAIKDTKTRIIDLNSNFDTTDGIIKNILKNSNSLNGSTQVLKNNLDNLSSVKPISLDPTNILDMLISKSKDLKEVLDGLSNIKISGQEEKGSLLQSLGTIEEKFKKTYLDKIGEYEKKVDSIINKLSKSGRLIGATDVNPKKIERLFKFYLTMQDIQPDIEKRMDATYKKAKELGISVNSANKLLTTLNNNKALVEIRKQLKDLSEESNKYLEDSLSNVSDFQKQITANQEAMNKFEAFYNKKVFELFEKTGKISFEGISFEGFEGLSEIVKQGSLQEIQSELDGIRLKIVGLKAEKEKLSKIEISSELYSQSQKRIADIDSGLKDLEKSEIDITSKLEQRKNILKNINTEQFKNIEYSKETAEIASAILALQVQMLDLESKGQLTSNLRTSYDLMLAKLKEMLLQEDKDIKAQKERTTYQIKYRNYLKENLDVELESLKIGKLKQEQEILTYTYKLKQLKLEKEVADAEKETAKEAFKNININKEWLDRVKNITDTKSGQNVINDFYKEFKNILKGESGKEHKNFYEALSTYVSAISKSENLGDKITLEPLKEINKFLLEIPNSVKTSLVALDTLSKEGIIPFSNYGQQILDQMKEDLEQNREKIFKSFGIVGKDIGTAIKDNLAQIDIFQSIKGDESKINDYIQKLKVKFKDNKDVLSEISLAEKSGTLSEKEALITKLITAEQQALLDNKEKELAVDKQDVELLKEKLKYLSSASKLLSLTGDVFGNKSISDIGKALEGIGDFQVNMKEIGKIDWKNILNEQNFNKALEGLFQGMNMGNTIGTAIGGITGGGMASQQGGALAGLLATGLDMTDWGAVGMAVGGSLLGGMFGGKDDKADAERRTKESNKLYNKNTEALQKLAQNMSNLSGGVDSLNNTLISAVSKIPTIDNINNVTDAMTSMYKTMEKTRKFNDVAYQVTKSKKSKGFLGLGGGSTSWTETIEVSVNEMLRRYGFKGALEDMTSQQIRDFSTWLDNYDLGDSDNFSVLADALEDYAEGLDKFDKNIQNFFRDSTMEAFSGISSLEQESLRQQIEDFYKNLGFQIDAETSKQIDKLAEEMSVMVTIMSDVRGEFLNQWRETGQSAGSVFLKSMTPYIDAMLGNISQIYYDVYFSGVNENLEKEFKNLSEQLVELKKQGKDLDWSSVTDKLSSSFGNVLNSIIATKNETASFNEILLELQKQALDAGLTLSEVLNLGLISGTQKDVMDAFKEALTSGENDGALTSIGEMLGDKIGETMANKMMDNLLSDRVLEFSAQIDKVMSGSLNFDSLAELSNQALSVGLLMSAEADRLSAIKELFSFKSNIEYTTQNEQIEYQTGSSSQQVYNVYVNGTVEAGNIIESDSTERLLESIIDSLIEKLRVDKGIDITKLRS